MGYGKTTAFSLCIALTAAASLFLYRERHSVVALFVGDNAPATTVPTPDNATGATKPHPNITGAATPSAPAKVPAAGRRRLADDPQALASAAAGLKLWEPETPAGVAGSFGGADQSLVDWLFAWQQRLAIGLVDQSFYLNDLEAALKKSALAPAQCVQLVRLASKWEDTGSDASASQPRYHAVSAAVARHAVWEASADIHADPASLNDIQATVAPLIRRLWYGAEPDLSKTSPDLLAVREFYTLLETFSPAGSADQHRGRDGRIETMILCNDFAGAEAEASAALVGSPNLTSDERADFAYLDGWSLYYLGRYPEAITALRVAAKWDNCEKCERALCLLAASQAHRGDLEAMNRTVKIWVDRFHPTAADALPMFSLLDSLNTNGSTDIGHVHAKGGA